MECALFGVPTVAMYKTSWSTYHVGKRIVQVNYLAMPNLLANSPVYPEFVQDAATPDAVGAAALELFRDDPRRARISTVLGEVIRSLGDTGATKRAADHILSLG
jgi:lipid-A-disaccharide synthase